MDMKEQIWKEQTAPTKHQCQSQDHHHDLASRKKRAQSMTTNLMFLISVLLWPVKTLLTGKAKFRQGEEGINIALAVINKLVTTASLKYLRSSHYQKGN